MGKRPFDNQRGVPPRRQAHVEALLTQKLMTKHECLLRIRSKMTPRWAPADAATQGEEVTGWPVRRVRRDLLKTLLEQTAGESGKPCRLQDESQMLPSVLVGETLSFPSPPWGSFSRHGIWDWGSDLSRLPLRSPVACELPITAPVGGVCFLWLLATSALCL